MKIINKLFEWLTEPVIDTIHSFPKIQDMPDISVDVIDTNYDMPKYMGNKPVLFRPTTFTEYIGQTKAKNILRSYITATKERKKIMPHTLIHGKSGCGKTTLAKILAHELEVKYGEVITSNLRNTADLINQINQVDGGVLFLDEIHSIDRDMAEGIYTIMEDFTFNGSPIKQFTLIGATTEYGELLKDRRPFVDRFKIPIELEEYTIDEIAKMARQYRNVVFPKDALDQNIFDIIAINSRATPRIAIRLTEATIYLKNDIKQVLRNFSIIRDSYTLKDLKVLQYINMNEKGVGLQGICSYLGTPMLDYTEEIEPFLLKNHLIIRTPRGRKITPQGIRKIEELETAIQQ